MLDVASLKLFIRSNGYAWPGGYPMALLMADGECIDARSARECYREIRNAMRHPHGANPSWKPDAVFIHWEGEPIQCTHSGRDIESAYGVPESEVQHHA